MPYRPGDPAEPTSMSKFRETLWFKRGDLFEVESDEDCVELPIEGRYLDTGGVSYTESAMFGLHSGQTTSMPRIALAGACEAESDLQVLIRELQRLNTRRFAMLGLAMMTLCLGLAGLH
jgi:hypothetical protein